MNQPVTIRHNQKLEHLTELNYKECYYVVVKKSTRDLAIKRSLAIHKAD